jgi:prophage maintenance system killer protein
MKDKTVPAFELNLKPVNGDGKKKDPKAKVEEALENIKMLISKQQEMQDVFAKATRTKFESLLKAGFTKDEALFLCK